ncbi:MAG: MurR/RpiR family transcriptional regulator [Lachnospiraceae bacterium]|nr:MurR/RpiR family transcriptional regulator [Lachnospiraceae bacterium]
MFHYSILQTYNDLEMLVYTYVMDHKDEVRYMTIRELAEAVHVSTSTVLRFCKKTGCDGYAEFKMKFKQFLMEGKKKQKIKDCGIDEIMYFFHTTTSTEYEEKINHIVRNIQDAKNLIFIGIGTSGILGKYGARFFSNIGKYSQYIEDPYYPIHEDLDDTIVIVLSESGETQQIIQMSERFKRHHAKILSITNGNSNTLAKIFDFHLDYFVRHHMVHEEYNITTQVPVIYLLETIGRRLI